MTFAKTLFTKLANDDAGFIVSAELVLVSTIVVLGMIVGLAEISCSVNEELEDVASAFGSMNQSFSYKTAKSCKGRTTGACFHDDEDECDSQWDIGLADAQAEN